MDSDAELVHRLRSGDEHAFTGLVELVTDYLDGTLSRAARRRFEAHLSGCPHCTEYLAQMRETIKLAGQLAPEDLTPQMRAEFTDLYRRWRSEQQ